MVLPRPERAALRLSWAGLAAALSVVLLVGRVDANGSLADVTCATNCTARCSRTSDCDSGCCMLACDNCVDDQCALCVACSAEACRGRCDPEVCTARCELRQWLTCSTGATGGCAFHDGNAHLELAKTWLESLRSQGLRGDECFHALHTGQLPARMVGCRECAPYLARVVQGLSAAAQLAVRSDSGIPVTPKEALIHLQVRRRRRRRLRRRQSLTVSDVLTEVRLRRPGAGAPRGKVLRPSARRRPEWRRRRHVPLVRVAQDRLGGIGRLHSVVHARPARLGPRGSQRERVPPVLPCRVWERRVARMVGGGAWISVRLDRGGGRGGFRGGAGGVKGGGIRRHYDRPRGGGLGGLAYRGPRALLQVGLRRVSRRTPGRAPSRR